MRETSRLVLICLGVLAVHAPVWAATSATNPLLPDVADSPNAVADQILSPQSTTRETSTESRTTTVRDDRGNVVTTTTGGDTKVKINGKDVSPGATTGRVAPAAASGPAAAPRVSHTGQTAGGGAIVKKHYTVGQREKMKANKLLRQAWYSKNAKVRERMRTAWARLGPDFINDQASMTAISDEMRRNAANDRAVAEARGIDPQYEGATQESGDEFFAEYGKLDGDDDVVGDPPPEKTAASTCSNCAAVAGTLERLNGTIGELNDRIARLEADRRIPAAVPVAVGPERNLTGNSIGFGIAIGPILQALLGQRNQQNRGQFFPNPGQRMFAPVNAGRAGPGGYGFGRPGYGGGPGRPGFGQGFAGGGPGFGPGGRGAPIYGGPASGGGYPGGGYGGGGYAGGPGSPAVFPYQNYQSGAGTIYNRSASAASPLSVGNLFDAPINAGPAA